MMPEGRVAKAADEVDAAIARVERALLGAPVDVRADLVDSCRRRLDALESGWLAEAYDSGATDRQVQRQASSGPGVSGAETKRRARRAKAVNANPDLGKMLSSGVLSTEQVDVIARAAADTEGEAACDSKLIEEISRCSVEQAKRIARDYVDERRTRDGVQSEHDRQRNLRRVYRYRTRRGTHALVLEGDETTIDQIERNIDAAADRGYRKDGGRDVAARKHPRTTDQRRFDAAATFFGSRPARRGSDRKPESGGGSRRRATMLVQATVDLLTGRDADGFFKTIDGKPLPDSVVADIAQDCDAIGQVFSANGELLWQGKRRRLASPAQIIGLSARDEGCVLCRKHPDRCVAHHLIPVESRLRGETNVSEMALVCDACHRSLHANQQTLYRATDEEGGAWRLRPATPDEIPVDTRSAKPPNPETLRYRDVERNPGGSGARGATRPATGDVGRPPNNFTVTPHP